MTCTYTLGTILAVVRAVTAIFLSLCVLGLGSGWLRHVHERAHAMHDAAPVEAQHDLPAERHHDDSSTCWLHAQLNLPVAPPAVVAVLIAIGLFVAFLTQLEPLRLPAVIHVRFGSRGPPVI